MPKQLTSRPISASERSALEEELSSSRQRVGERNEMLLGPGLTLLLVLAGLWALLNWLAKTFLDLDVGLRSPAAPWMLAVGVLILVLVIGPELLKTRQRSQSVLRSLVADLSSGMVEEQVLKIADAMRFQEPEHGGFLYFFRTCDGQVYVQFDHERQDLGVDGRDPTLSKYIPRSVLTIVRAPQSGRILASEFSGDLVRVSETKVLTAKPRKWPEPDTFCKTPWPELISTYAA